MEMQISDLKKATKIVSQIAELDNVMAKINRMAVAISDVSSANKTISFLLADNMPPPKPMHHPLMNRFPPAQEAVINHMPFASPQIIVLSEGYDMQDGISGFMPNPKPIPEEKKSVYLDIKSLDGSVALRMLSVLLEGYEQKRNALYQELNKLGFSIKNDTTSSNK